jgi:ABC-type uncharacterized transport system substrate-binding protein
LTFLGVAFLLTAGHLPPTAAAEESTRDQPVTPIVKAAGKWRIGYLQGGDYEEYPRTLISVLDGLMGLGWIEKRALPPAHEMTGNSLWEFCATELKSDFLEFVPDAFHSADWNPEKRKEVVGALVQRLNIQKDLDLMIAMGTWAGIDLSRGNHGTPTIVVAVSDAVASGIIKSIHDSGNDIIHARVDPERYERQVQIFHTIIGFETLGMVYRNDVAGRSYAAVETVKKVGRERGFTIRTCFLADEANQADDESRLIQCFEQLCSEVDAIYITGQKAVNDRTVPMLAEIAKKAEIPTFSQSGLGEVRAGLLMSISQAGFKYVGEFYAATIARVLNGALPGKLNQIFEDPSKIAINLTTAEAIKFYPSLEVLSSADEIFR